MSDYLTTLVLLREHRRAADITTRNIESITAAANLRNPLAPVITADRLRQLETAPRHEPTYAEARTLTRLLGLTTVAALITPASLHAMPDVFGAPQPDDLTNFRLSADVPLSIACRLAISLGLDDPLELDHLPIHAQLWDVLATGERFGVLGTCPWCGGNTTMQDGRHIAAQPHLPTCLPAALWSPDNPLGTYATGVFPRPAKPRTRGDSHIAHGLKVIRAAKGITQQSLASDIGRNANYMSRIERLEVKLTQQNAEKIATRLGVPVERLFMRPAPVAPLAGIEPGAGA